MIWVSEASCLRYANPRQHSVWAVSDYSHGPYLGCCGEEGGALDASRERDVVEAGVPGVLQLFYNVFFKKGNIWIRNFMSL